MGRLYNKSHQSSHNKDEASVHQTPGEPGVETKQPFQSAVTLSLIYLFGK